MENNRKPLHFFLGANTPQGFVSRFDQLANPAEGWREFVLKVAEHTAGRCGQIELIHCSSDVDSLDGVILPEIKTSIADGTSPHVSAM